VKKEKYLELYDRFKMWGYLWHINVSFIPAKDLGCNRPYIAGKRDSCWIKVHVGERINVCDKNQCESLVGMSLLPIS
jgi:hypothetical protein